MICFCIILCCWLFSLKIVFLWKEEPFFVWKIKNIWNCTMIDRFVWEFPTFHVKQYSFSISILSKRNEVYRTIPYISFRFSTWAKSTLYRFTYFQNKTRSIIAPSHIMYASIIQLQLSFRYGSTERGLKSSPLLYL